VTLTSVLRYGSVRLKACGPLQRKLTLLYLRNGLAFGIPGGQPDIADLYGTTCSYTRLDLTTEPVFRRRMLTFSVLPSTHWRSGCLLVRLTTTLTIIYEPCCHYSLGRECPLHPRTDQSELGSERRVGRGPIVCHLYQTSSLPLHKIICTPVGMQSLFYVGRTATAVSQLRLTSSMITVRSADGGRD